MIATHKGFTKADEQDLTIRFAGFFLYISYFTYPKYAP